jgi:hypothetical protein
MKLFLVVVVALVASLALGIIQPAEWWDTYQQLYPSDPEQRRALDQCFTLDAQFSRLDANQREACYRHYLPGGGAAVQTAAMVPRPTAPAAANFVDLWRAAGQGHLPQNDIRAEQQNDRFMRPQPASALR